MVIKSMQSSCSPHTRTRTRTFFLLLVLSSPTQRAAARPRCCLLATLLPPKTRPSPSPPSLPHASPRCRHVPPLVRSFHLPRSAQRADLGDLRRLFSLLLPSLRLFSTKQQWNQTQNNYLSDSPFFKHSVNDVPQLAIDRCAISETCICICAIRELQPKRRRRPVWVFETRLGLVVLALLMWMVWKTIWSLAETATKWREERKRGAQRDERERKRRPRKNDLQKSEKTEGAGCAQRESRDEGKQERVQRQRETRNEGGLGEEERRGEGEKRDPGGRGWRTRPNRGEAGVSGAIRFHDTEGKGNTDGSDQV